jgi:hypothetical protein
MASFTTSLTNFSNSGDSVVYTQDAHTVAKPLLVLQKRKVPTGNQTMQETTLSTVNATVDAVSSEVLSQKILFQTVVRTPIAGAAADVTAALATHIDLVSSDEFANAVSTQEWIQ